MLIFQSRSWICGCVSGRLNPVRCITTEITVPLRLQKRLEKNMSSRVSKYEEHQRIIQASRRGSLSRILISCRRREYNHYYGQSYSANDDLPLASKGWTHRKAAGDFFTIKSHSQNYALLRPDEAVTFADVGVCKTLIDSLKCQNISKPTVIQAYGIPKVLSGSNCVLASETGCGKTIAYLVPVLQQILELKRSRKYKEGFNEPLALIVVPTRELAEQIFSVADRYAEGLGISVKLLQGGNLGSKIKNPATQVTDLIVSTVNVISTLNRLDVYTTKKVGHIVLDEADTLLDDSFSPAVINFLQPFPFGDGKCQLTLVSATMPRDIDNILAEAFPVESFVHVETPGLHRVMVHVPQMFLRLKKLEKPAKLLELAKAAVASKTPLMIFCNKSDTCSWLSKLLTETGIDCIALTGDILPSKRKGKLELYQSGEVGVLVCTDVGSRGLDTLRTGHVINYDFPRFLADYIHRCGRTGRVGSHTKGHVTNFVSWPTEVQLVQEIERAVRKETSLQKVNANIKRLLNARYGNNQAIEPIHESQQVLHDSNHY